MAAITEDGRLVTWGNPDRGKLGHKPKEMDKSYKPTLYADQSEMDFVHGLEGVDIAQVSLGKHHTVALSSTGDVYTWGHGKEGALGHGTVEEQDVPKKVEGLSNIKSISSGGDFTLCLHSSGELISFGKNTYGQLGH